ncbi:hypothetical protein YC2023_032339 [Brassica napus]
MSDCKEVSTPLGTQFRLKSLDEKETLIEAPFMANKGQEFIAEGFSDADYGNDLDRRRSVTGYLFQVGTNTISWRSGLQPIVALSSTESEYMALNEAAKEALWIKGLCEDLDYKQGAVKINCDSKSAIFLTKNGGYHERTKHIHTKYNFIRDVIADGSVSVVKIHTTLNLADILTKSVPGRTLEKALAFVKQKGEETWWVSGEKEDGREVYLRYISKEEFWLRKISGGSDLKVELGYRSIHRWLMIGKVNKGGG